MSEDYNAKLAEAEELVEKDDFAGAFSIIRQIPYESPYLGKIAYILAIVAIKTDDTEMALEYINLAEKEGTIDPNLLYQKAKIMVETNETEGVEDIFERLHGMVDDEDELWAVYDVEVRYFLNNELFLNADKLAKEMIQKYPDSYHGFHHHFTIEMQKKEYDNAKACLDIVPDELKNNGEYYLDLAQYLIETDEDKFYEIIKSDENFMKYIPEYTLKNIYHKAKEDEDIELMMESLKKLAFDYKDQDGMLGMLMLLHASQSYDEAIELARVMIELNKNETNIYFLYALYYQMFNFYEASEGKPSESMKQWIYEAGKTCIELAQIFDEEEITDTVISSVNFLIEKIQEPES